MTVVGRTRVSEPASPGPRPAGQVRRIDVPAIAADLPYPLYGGYLDRITEDPRARPSPEVLVLPELGDGPHLVYAVQWWLFALLALGGFLVLARREAADRGAPPPVRRAPARAG